MSNTRHRTLRMNDENWAKVIEAFRAAVPEDQRPVGVSPETNWQVTEGLRRIAAGEIILTPKT